MTDLDRTRWEIRYTSGDMPAHLNANHWMVTQAPLFDAMLAARTIPPHALDIACGSGSALIWLAERGWRVTGVDISPTALANAHARLKAAGILDRATLLEADLDIWRPAAASYDLVTCFHFLDRRLWPAMRAAVTPNGLVCLRTFHTGRLASHPETNPAHLLQPGELAALIHSWGWRLLAEHTDGWTEAVLGQRGAEVPITPIKSG